ncbi:MAG: permease-like cell division protein FtsX [Bifidobacteriaceae bacterium]|jgi:cell division transport system permease protein|nr:permease-like cell division protein FtsX [Bifidobacteriaceae bacterium]
MRFRFVLGEIGAGFRRNATMISAVILVTFVSLAAVGGALLLQMQIDKLRGDWWGKFEVSVWLCPVQDVDGKDCPEGGVTADQQAAVLARLDSEEMKPFVKGFVVQPREEVYEEYMRGFGGADWAGGVTVDTFPPIIKVTLKEQVDYSVVKDAVQSEPGVYQVQDPSDLLNPLFNVLNKAQVMALAVAAVLMVAAILLISTTIRLSAMSRQRETGIMRLVGASNLFIQLPFMLEGAVAALLGSLLSVTTLWFVTRFWLAGWMKASFGDLMSRISANDVFVVAPWLILAAVALAAMSSVLTLRRFIKV